ncbi:hypothetical protein BV25DRAFT_99472 [Artomyces pyxidatus]|uniref:Uncharacterized protein n=1 Tax=Artomyces pyxidatus TaxID=48021 RepID=A0ACB8TL46_9AGAM|nr:hypothetical protein BV25DRAFT_99472 [Artomyces pyxidatus]
MARHMEDEEGKIWVFGGYHLMADLALTLARPFRVAVTTIVLTVGTYSNPPLRPSLHLPPDMHVKRQSTTVLPIPIGPRLSSDLPTYHRAPAFTHSKPSRSLTMSQPPCYLAAPPRLRARTTPSVLSAVSYDSSSSSSSDSSSPTASSSPPSSVPPSPS